MLDHKNVVRTLPTKCLVGFFFICGTLFSENVQASTPRQARKAFQDALSFWQNGARPSSPGIFPRALLRTGRQRSSQFEKVRGSWEMKTGLPQAEKRGARLPQCQKRLSVLHQSPPLGASEGVFCPQNKPAAEAKDPDLRRVFDLTYLPFYTLDHKKTKIMDDGIAVEPQPDGSLKIHIAVVDPTALIKPGSSEDIAAIKKMRSRRGKPFEHARVAQISMNPGAERRALVLSFILAPDGTMVEHPVLRRSKIRSRGRVYNREATNFLRGKRKDLAFHGVKSIDTDMSENMRLFHRAARALNQHMGMKCRKGTYSAEVIVQKFMTFFNREMGRRMEERIRFGYGGFLKAQTVRDKPSFYTSHPRDHISLGGPYISASNGARMAASLIALSLILEETPGERWLFIMSVLGQEATENSTLNQERMEDEDIIEAHFRNGLRKRKRKPRQQQGKIRSLNTKQRRIQNRNADLEELLRRTGIKTEGYMSDDLQHSKSRKKRRRNRKVRRSRSAESLRPPPPLSKPQGRISTTSDPSEPENEGQVFIPLAHFALSNPFEILGDEG